jgi:hypothetical protein
MFGRKALLGKFLSHAFCNIFAMHQYTFTTVQYFIYTFLPNFYFLSPSTVHCTESLFLCTGNLKERVPELAGFWLLRFTPHQIYCRRLWSRYAPIRYAHLRVKLSAAPPPPPPSSSPGIHLKIVRVLQKTWGKY